MTRPILRRGSTGSDVAELQEALRLLGYCGQLSPTGLFDAATNQAVIQFQQDNGLTADGVVCDRTWATLDHRATNAPVSPVSPQPFYSTIRPGDQGEEVRTLQIMLYILGYYDGSFHANFDVLTQQAVMAFQSTHGITPNGTVYSNTWNALSSAISNYTSPPPVECRPTLQLDDIGDAVQVVQMMLKLLGYYDGPITATFDEATRQAVMAFQAHNGLMPNGLVGPDTWAALSDAITPISPPPPAVRPTIRLGDTGETVQVLQIMLRLLGYYNGQINSVFDEATEQAVVAFQQHHGLLSDGVVDPATWAQLDRDIAKLPPIFTAFIR